MRLRRVRTDGECSVFNSRHAEVLEFEFESAAFVAASANPSVQAHDRIARRQKAGGRLMTMLGGDNERGLNQ